MKIDSYHFGRIEIDGRTYRSDVIITPERVVDTWWRKERHSLSVQDLGEVMATKPDIVVVGTGYYGFMRVPEETKAYLSAHGVEMREAKTGDAIREFNRLQQDAAQVIAALHLSC